MILFVASTSPRAILSAAKNLIAQDKFRVAMTVAKFEASQGMC